METEIDFDVKLGNIIRHYRKLNHCNQKQLARLLDITPQQLQKYEKGKNKINFEKLLKISNIFNIDVNELAGRIENYKKHSEYELELNKDSMKLLRNYSLTKSKKFKKLLLLSSEIFAENNYNSNVT